MKLWFDDIRPAPDKSWVWARTVHEAKCWLQYHDVDECSLDHDMGLHELEPKTDPDDDYWELVIQLANQFVERPAEEGLALVDWMIENDRVPPVVTIHSWNIGRAREMAARLNDHGHSCVIRPYEEVRP